MNKKKIIMIGGSRGITDINLSSFIDKNTVSKVISGGAKGVDTLAEKWAKRNHIEFVCYPAFWDRYGKRAGIMRNEDMVNAVDICYFFWDGKSPGTKQAIEYAASIGREYYLHLFNDLD